MKRSIITCIIFLVCCFGLAQIGSAQDWDFEKHPRMNVDLTHLNADIRIEESGAIEGDVLYRSQLKMDAPDSLIFDAAGLDIHTVTVNENPVEFMLRGDKLVIILENVYARSSILNIRIQYDAIPGFGVHRDVKGTMWTSMLPRSVRHWIPVIDHPRVQFTTELVFTHPSGNAIIANGRRMESDILNVNEEVTTFSSDVPIPASGLAWVTGSLSELESGQVNNLRQNSGTSGLGESGIRIQVYSEDVQDTVAVTEIAATAVKSIREELGVEYPYRDLHIIVLEEDFWETKSYAAGILFIYKDRGNLEQQVQSGVLSQWAGSKIREEQWSDADAIHMIHATLANRLFDFEYSIEKTDPGLYSVFSNQRYSEWEYYLKSTDVSSFHLALDIVLGNLLMNGHHSLGWNELADYIYENTGQPFYEGFEPGMVEVDEDSLQPTEYTARIEWNETEQTIQIHFEAVNQPIDELVSVHVEETTFRESKSHEVTFTGNDDSSVISISSGIENVKLSIEERDHVTLNVEKPFLFWIYQLRNDESPEERGRAADALAGFTDNPDLQLALDDILRVESNPHVYAEIVRSLSKLTRGAAGMDERFLDYSSSQQHPEVRIAAIEALAYYQGSERAISRLRSVSVQSENPELQEAAIRSLSEITDAERFSSIAGDIVSTESLLDQVPFILRLLAEKGAEESAVDIASTFISEQFPYDIRKEALEILLQYDRSPGNWEERLPGLLTDRHPNIRYRSTEAIEYLGSGAARNIVAERLPEEYDERVRRALQNIEY